MKQFLTLLALLPLLTACAMQNPSFINQAKINVMPEEIVFERPADRVTPHDLRSIADDVKHRGEGPVTVSILHLSNAAQSKIAQLQAGKIKSFLQNERVTQPIIMQFDRNGVSKPNFVTIHYQALAAEANCSGTIEDADADNYTHAHDNPYSLGCSRDRYISAMIARPADLLGNDATTQAESQRVGKSMELYRAGESATPANTQSLSASDVYNK